MIEITAIYGSPRKKGNTAALLAEAVRGARDAGASVHEIVLRDKKVSPCLEIYGCLKTGKCVIKDDFGEIRDRMLASDGIMLASPIFFYSVSAHTKMLIDRCQSLWVEKYWYRDGDDPSEKPADPKRKCLFISVGATKGKKLFDGVLLTMKYFLDVLDAKLWKSCLYRGLDFGDDILKHPGYLKEAYEAGKALVVELRK